MAYTGYVVKVEKLRPHTNADKLQIATFFGNDTCVGLNVVHGEIGIYFPTDGQLSEEYCKENNLVRVKDENGNNIGGYMDPDKRNVTTIRLRGEKSDGLFMPLSSVVYTGVNLDELNVGDMIDTLNGHEICRKYIPRGKKRNHSGTPKAKKVKVNVAPLFAEHADTEQLAYNLSAFKPGDLVEITLKMHGTSQRTAHLPVFKGYKDTFAMKVRNAIGNKLSKTYKEVHGEPVYEYGYVSGTRRTVLKSFDAGFYGSDEFRRPHAEAFEGKLLKGESVYYEVVGFAGSERPIMATVDNKKTADKEFIKKYGKTTTFSYGCEAPNSDCYVYRMTMTNEDGDVVEYTPDYMRYRCEQMGVKTVPVFWTGFIPEDENADEFILAKAEEFFDGTDPVGKTHVREGVVCRILNRPKFAAYKHKNFAFKCLEGIAKANAEAPDMEEAQELEEV